MATVSVIFRSGSNVLSLLGSTSESFWITIIATTVLGAFVDASRIGILKFDSFVHSIFSTAVTFESVDSQFCISRSCLKVSEL